MKQSHLDSLLRCVALPIHSRDIEENLESTFRLWSDARFSPATGNLTDLPHLMVVVNCASSETLAEIEMIYRRDPSLARCFSNFSVHSAEPRGDRDIYARNESRPVGVFGNKAGPNFLFQSTMQIAAVHGGFTLQIELDCIPVEAGRLEKTAQVIAGNSRAWVIGSLFASSRGLGRSAQAHLNGNACYNTGDAKFIAFLNDVWMADLVALAAKHPNMAYDCWWANELFQANALTGNDSWSKMQTFASFFHTDPFIVNLLSDECRLHEFVDGFEKFVNLGRPPIFFTGPQ